MNTTTTNPLKPLFSTRETRAALGGIGTTKLYALLRDGKLKRVKLGAKTLITAESVHALVTELSAGSAA